MSEEALNQEAEEQIEEPVEAAVEEHSEVVEEEGDTLSNFSELAEHLEVESDFLLNLKVGTKVDGQPAEATIQDLVNSYQTQQAAEHRLTDAKDKAKVIIQEASQEREAVKADLGVAAGLVMMAEQLFGETMSSEDLLALKNKDESAYLIEKDRLTEQRKALDAAKAEIGARVQAYMNPGVTQEDITNCRKSLVEALPHLEPVEARTKLAEYIMTQGFSRDDLSVTTDHRLFVLAEKARQFDELKGKTDAAKKKVVQIPKVMKPGAKTKAQAEEPKDAAEILYG